MKTISLTCVSMLECNIRYLSPLMFLFPLWAAPHRLIACICYSIAHFSLVHHLVLDWQPDAPFSFVCSRRGRANCLQPAPLHSAWLQSGKRSVQ